MIPIQGTAAVLTAPSSPLQTSGYVPGNTLAAQVFNWYLYHLTAEINNVLSGQNLSQNTLDDSQLLKAVGRTNLLISTSGTVTTATQFAGNTLTQFANLTGSSNYVITAGAARPGIELIVEALTGSGVMIVNGSGSAFLGSGAVRLLWDGSAWCKIGGVAFTRIFTSGSAATWITPWKGSYKVTACGGGGGGEKATGNIFNSGAGGGGGGAAIKLFLEIAGAILTYTIGSGGSGGTSTSGSNGNPTTVGDGNVTITGSGGGGGGVVSTYSSGVGGVSNGGDLNINGNSGVGGFNGVTGMTVAGGAGGGSVFGGGGAGVQSGSGSNGQNYGGGGAGGCNANGGTGSSGVVVVEF